MSNGLMGTMQQLGTTRLAIMGGIVAALLAFFVFLSMRITTGSMKLLYADLSSSDSAAVSAKLEESQIPYEVSPDGSRILVQGGDVGRARMLLAADGLPNGGSIGYEIFDKQSGFGTTNFVQNINQVRALEGELARTIGSLENIRSARVHIVLPQREIFSRENKKSTASVFLGIRAGSIIEREQILAIQSLVASAVPDLKPTNVSIIDSNGNLLQKGNDDTSELLPVKAEDMRRSLEENLRSKIEEQVSRIVGFGKVTAIVTAEVNFDRVNTNEELFNPEGQVLRSTQSSQEGSKEKEAANNEVTVGNNLPNVSGDLLGDSGPSAESSRTEEVNNYEISKTVRNTVRDIGEIKKLSVSVLIDGRYNTDKDGVQTYEPRPQEEMDRINALVKSAVGFDEERGDTLEVANLQFAAVDTKEEFHDERFIMGFEKSDLISAAEVFIVAIMVILVILLVIRPMVSRLIDVPGAGAAPGSIDPNSPEGMALLAVNPMHPALAAPQQYIGPDGIPVSMNPTGGSEFMSGSDEHETQEMINIDGIEGKVKASTVKKVEEIVEAYPKETVAVIRSWMTQES